MEDDVFNLENIICSNEWMSLVKLWKLYCEDLQKRVNQYLKAGDYRNADRTQAKLECIQNMSYLVKNKIKELKGGE